MALFFFLFLSLFIGLFVKGLYNRTHGKEYGKFYGFSLLSLALLMILTRIPERQDETEVVVEEQEVIEEPEEESEHPVFEQKVYVPPQNDEKEVKEEPKERTYSWIINTNTLKVLSSLPKLVHLPDSAYRPTKCPIRRSRCTLLPICGRGMGLNHHRPSPPMLRKRMQYWLSACPHVHHGN